MKKICLFYDYLSAVPVWLKHEMIGHSEARIVDESERKPPSHDEGFSRQQAHAYSDLVREMRSKFAGTAPTALSSLLKMTESFQLKGILSKEALKTLQELGKKEKDRINEIPVWALKPENWFLLETKQPAFELQSVLSSLMPCAVFDDGPIQCLAPQSVDVDLTQQEIIIEVMGIHQLWDLGNYGQHAEVSVLDTGFTPTPTVTASVQSLSVAGLDIEDYDGHGTAIVSIVSAIAPRANVRTIKIMRSYSEGSIWNLVSGLTSLGSFPSGVVIAAVGVDPGWLSSQGASVVAFEESITNIIRSANSAGHFVIGAAGNDGLASLRWPAACQDILAVGAHNFNILKSSFSNYSMESANIVLAPGGERRSRDGRIEGLGRYGVGLSREMFGTSFSAAAACGFSALLESYGWFKQMQIPSRISLFHNHCRKNEDGLPILNVPDIGAVWPIDPRSIGPIPRP